MGKSVVAIVGGSLIDGTGKPIVKNSVVLIEGSVIKSAGDDVRVPRGAEIIKADGKIVMPGMIDVHVHLASVVGVDPDATTAIMRTPTTLLVLHAARHAREMLEAGFTSVRDLGGQMIHSGIVSLREAIRLGLVPGPRILVAGWVEMTGGHGDFINNWYATWPRNRDDPSCADGLWEIRKRIREYARDGVDLIKTASSRLVCGYSGEPRRSYTLEEFRTLVDEAHALGMKVACHSWSSDGNIHALKAGVDTLEHGGWLSDEAIRMMVKSGTILVPTLSLNRPGTDLTCGAIVPVRPELVESFRKARQAGVKIAMGTDTYRMLRNYWGQNAYELELMVKEGMSEMEAIVATTQTAAEALGLEKKIGTIEKGKLGDIIIVDGNPLADIKVLQDKEKIQVVMKDGDLLVNRMNSG